MPWQQWFCKLVNLLQFVLLSLKHWCTGTFVLGETYDVISCMVTCLCVHKVLCYSSEQNLFTGQVIVMLFQDARFALSSQISSQFIPCPMGTCISTFLQDEHSSFVNIVTDLKYNKAPSTPNIGKILPAAVTPFLCMYLKCNGTNVAQQDQVSYVKGLCTYLCWPCTKNNFISSILLLQHSVVQDAS
jgi:hypothetical protein